jgi:hypothetical protein
VVRRFEVDTFLAELRAVRTVVLCRPYPAGRVPLPDAVHDAVEQDFSILTTSDGCDIRRRRIAP